MGLLDDVVSGIENIGVQVGSKVRELTENGVRELKGEIDKAVEWFDKVPDEAQTILNSLTKAGTEKAAEILHDAGVVAGDAAKELMQGIDKVTKPIGDLLSGLKEEIEKAIANNAQ